MSCCRRGMFIVSVLLAMSVWLMTLSRADAWGAGGHRVVANIAFDRLDAATKAKIVKVLRNHDDFKRHFDDMMPDDIRSGPSADRDRWIFLQAAIWPDLIRPKPPYHHETWHFVNFPYFLSDADEMALKDSIKPNVLPKLPSPLSDETKKTLNCMQAFKLCFGEVSDSHTTVGDKAIDYCWLLHIAGDTHQPLHSTSLISRGRFNESEGDRGGHLPIKKIGKATSLHAYWDELHGEEQTMQDIIDRTSDILSSDAVLKAAEKAAANLKIEDWVLESHQFAKDVVYDKAILNAVSAAEMSHILNPITLSATYRTKAQELANQRVAEAGYRLAEILKQVN